MAYDFITQPLGHNVAARTSRDVCRDAVAIEVFVSPSTVWAPFWIALAIGFIAALVACYLT